MKLENVVSGLVIERLGGCLLVEVVSASIATATDLPDLVQKDESFEAGRFHVVCYQRSAMCDAQIVVGDYVDLIITSTTPPAPVAVDDEEAEAADHSCDPAVDPAGGTDVTAGATDLSAGAASGGSGGSGGEVDSSGSDASTHAASVQTVQGVVVRHHERRNLLARPAPMGGSSINHFRYKAIAANVDQIVVVVAASPVVPISSVDRILVAAHAYDMQAILVVNKVDLEGTGALLDSLAHYPRLGYPLLPVSVVTGEGLEDLQAALRGKNSVFVGQSGIGKSSLVNTLLPAGARYTAKVGALVKSVNLGAHTTSSSRLFHLTDRASFSSGDSDSGSDSSSDSSSGGDSEGGVGGGGCIIDSPGIRELGLWHLSEDDIKEGFVEIAELSDTCKFRNCQHTPDTLGCAVQRGIADGTVHPSRLASYFTFLQMG
jgi:ribosome small subunit-dependent GTPase A